MTCLVLVFFNFKLSVKIYFFGHVLDNQDLQILSKRFWGDGLFDCQSS